MTPWKILGIKAGSDRDTIRRAYAKKLKGVNPEDDPDGFMRLRRAHDEALQQLKWRQEWPEAAIEAADEPPQYQPVVEAEVAALPPPDPVWRAERDDLAERQQAFVDAIATGPAGQATALEQLLAAPALEGISARDRIEGWIAGTIRARLPASDPLVVPAISQFGWGEIGSAPPGSDVAALLQRREEGEFVARIARPHTELFQGYKALSRPPARPWLARLGALFGGAVPGETRQILGLADGPLPGITDWLNPQAIDFWREWHSVPRLRLWMILVMFPLAAAALVVVLEATGWPQPVQMGIGVLAYGAPFGLLWLLRFRMRFQNDWQRPDWHYQAWQAAGLALPLAGALWPPAGVLGPLWLALVTLVTALTLISTNKLLPDAPKTLMIGLVRAWPAWFLLWLLLLGAPVAGWARPVLGLLVPALAIIWWQGGDELVWAAQRRLGRWAPWILCGAAAAIGSAAGPLLMLATPDPDWAARALALIALALLLALMAFRLVLGWQQLLPAVLMAGLLVVAGAGIEGLRPARPRAPPAATTQPQALGGTDDWLDARALLKGQKPGAYRFRLAITVAADGRVPRCVLERGTGVVALDQALCPQFQARARYRPARDGQGRAVATDLQLSGGWTIRNRPALSPGPEARAVPLLPKAVPPRPVEPIITCPAATGTGPMVAEPCMRERWIGDGDYPAAAMARGQSGKVGYRLLIDATGRVERCDIVESSGHAPLDKGTCDLIRRRARFVPARGADGAPMEWSYRSAVDWVLSAR